MKQNDHDIYHFLADRLYDHAEKRGNLVSLKRMDARNLIGYVRLPREIQVSVLDNLEKMGLIKRKNKRVIIIKNLKGG